MARTLSRVGGARAFFLSWLALCQGRLGGSPERAGGGPVAIIRPGGRKSGGRVRLLGRQSAPAGCSCCVEASGPSFLGMSGAWCYPEKTVSTLEKTKVLTVFSTIEFSKVLTGFGGFSGVKTGALTACGNDALCGFRGWTGVPSSFGAVSSALWTRKKASGGEAFVRNNGSNSRYFAYCARSCFTLSEMAFPSAFPASRLLATPITLPMSLGLAAPVSAMMSRRAASSSASLSGWGR